jgi:hypothetical protein
MKNVEFSEANRTIGAPAGFEETQVQPARVYCGIAEGGSCDGVPISVVAWQPTPEEILNIIGGGPIYVTMMGGVAPHFVTTSFDQATKPA